MHVREAEAIPKQPGYSMFLEAPAYMKSPMRSAATRHASQAVNSEPSEFTRAALGDSNSFVNTLLVPLNHPAHLFADESVQSWSFDGSGKSWILGPEPCGSSAQVLSGLPKLERSPWGFPQRGTLNKADVQGGPREASPLRDTDRTPRLSW